MSESYRTFTWGAHCHTVRTPSRCRSGIAILSTTIRQATDNIPALISTLLNLYRPDRRSWCSCMAAVSGSETRLHQRTSTRNPSTSSATTDQWQFDLDVGILDTEYTDLTPGSELTLDAAFGMAPELQYSFGGQWNGDLPNGTDVTMRLDYIWTDGYNRTYVPGDHSTRYSGAEFEQPSFGLLNARLIFAPGTSNWEVAIFGTNLTDERYTDGGFMSPLLQVDDGTIGRPREAGVTIRFDFD